MRRIAIALALAGLLTGCSGPKDTPIPTDLKDIAQIEALKPQLDKLSPEDKELAGKFLVLHVIQRGLGEALGVKTDPLPEGMTLGEAIEEQKRQDKKSSERKALAKAQEKKAEAERSAARAEIKRRVQVSLEETRLVKPNVRQGEFQSFLIIAVAIENKGDKGINGVKGNLVFKDKFGDTIYKTEFKTQKSAPAGQKTIVELSAPYNPFMAGHKRMAAAEPGSLSMEFEPLIALFDDGSKLEAP